MYSTITANNSRTLYTIATIIYLIGINTMEGGIRTPFLAKFQATFTGAQKNNITHEFATVMDLAPTTLEMAGVTHPAPTYQGREVVPK